MDFLEGPGLYRAHPRSGNAPPATPGAVNATREVVLAAGTPNTSQLLKISGIGPQSELQSLNISVLVDLLGVGTNM
jgi:choline dehydrogenase